TQWCLKRSTAAIWTSNIFKTAIYKNFERQLLEAIDAYNGPYHVSQRTQMVLPGMCAAVFVKLWQIFFAFGDAHFNSPQKPPVYSHTIFSAPGSSSSPSPNPPSSSASTPTTQWYTLNRNIVTVTDV
ncbi:hypothetical protein BCV71DRAFT_239735, partial [Rhizopus microsporus]